MKKLAGLFFILLGVMVFISALANSGVGRWFTLGNEATEAVSSRGIHRIEVRGSALDLRILPGDREEVSAVLRGGRKDALSVTRSGDTVSISVGKRWFHWIFMGDRLRLDLHIPRHYAHSLILDVDSGDVQFHGPSKNRPMVLEELELELDSGDVELSHLKAGRIRHRSWSGNVNARHVSAEEADWRLTSGNLRLRNYSGSLGVKMTSGDLEVQMDRLAGPVEATLTSGDVSLDLPRGAGFTLDAGVTSGDIHVDFPMRMVERRERRVSGSHGSGEHPIRLRTTSGDIRIR